MWTLVLLGIVTVGVIIIVVFAVAGGNTTSSNNKLKTVFGTCNNNFDCKLGFHCELRDHPSNGICVIPPGGACHPVEENLKGVACYSGYYCDKQEGVCLKSN